MEQSEADLAQGAREIENGKLEGAGSCRETYAYTTPMPATSPSCARAYQDMKSLP